MLQDPARGHYDSDTRKQSTDLTPEQRQQVRQIIIDNAHDLARYEKLVGQEEKRQHDIEIASGCRDDANSALASMQSKRAELAGAYFDKLRSSLIEQVGVTADGQAVYRKVLDPEAMSPENAAAYADLQRARRAVRDAQDNLPKANTLHDEAYAMFRREADEAVKRGAKLASKMKPNTWANYVIGTSFTTVDVVQAGLERGLGGALTEIVGKVAEAGVQYLLDAGMAKVCEGPSGSTSMPFRRRSPTRSTSTWRHLDARLKAAGSIKPFYRVALDEPFAERAELAVTVQSKPQEGMVLRATVRDIAMTQQSSNVFTMKLPAHITGGLRVCVWLGEQRTGG